MRSKQRSAFAYWREYLSVAPFFLVFIAFALIPLIYAAYLTTQSWDGLGPSEFVGLQQWERFFRKGDFWPAMGNTILIFLMGQIPVVLGALVAAVVLARPKLRGRGFYQTAFFLPQVTSLVAITVVFQSFFSGRFGFVNLIASYLGLPIVDWLNDPWGTRIVIALMIFWRGFGYFLVIFLAGLSAIDRSLYEAATLDGASGTRTFWSITVPLLRPTLLFVILTGTISGLQIFTEPQLLFSGQAGPQDAGLTMMLLQYQYLGGPGSVAGYSPVPTDLGYATVIGWATFILLLGIAMINYRLLKKPVDE